MALKVGVAAAPVVGPANNVLADWVWSVTARVPLVVTGDPATDRKLGTVSATEVTVPVAVPGGTAKVPSSLKNFAPVGVPEKTETTPDAVAAVALPPVPCKTAAVAIVGIVGAPDKSE
jgi:hypothetical protein